MRGIICNPACDFGMFENLMSLRAPGGLAFTLTDTSVSTVPVPASIWLLAT
jgi:hypothetical protein